MILSEEDLKQRNIVGAFVNILKQNFFKNFIVVMFFKFEGNVCESTKIKVIDSFFQKIDGDWLWVLLANESLLHADEKWEDSKIFFI